MNQKALLEDRKVKVSFQNVELLTPTFLNNAIGQLYGDFSEEKIKGLLSVSEISQEDVVLLKRVIDNAKLFYKDTDRMQKSIDEILGE